VNPLGRQGCPPAGPGVSPVFRSAQPGQFLQHRATFPLAAAAVAPLRAKAESLGSADYSPLWSGQNATGCIEVTAAEITRELAGGL
jgi:hypothetical protein